MFRELRQQTEGAASMIVVIFISIVLSIMTIGFIRVAINEQRQSTDFDLSQRAYYAAESGIEDARRAVRDYLGGELTEAELNADVCDLPRNYSGVLSDDPDFDIEYTCMFIDLTPAAFRATFDGANITKQFTVKPVNSAGNPANFQTLTMNWHLNDLPAQGGDGLIGSGVNLRGSGDVSLPRRSSWNHPAMMEVTFISHPRNGLQRSNIQDSTVFLSPNTGSNGSSGTVFGAGVDGRVRAASCSAVASGGYACSMQFNFNGYNATANELTMRMTTHYAATSIELSLSSGANGNGAPRLFDDMQATVDVTGRAGQVFRRVEAALDLNEHTVLPGYAVQSATDICKNFSFTNDLADFGGVAGTSCN